MAHKQQLISEAPPLDRTPINKAIEKVMARLRQQGRVPYCINTDPPNGLAALGYVRCALELICQMEDEGIKQAEIFVTSGGGTQAGLLLGSLLLQAPYKVTGISYHARSILGRQEHIATMATAAARLLGFDFVVRPELVDNSARYATQHLFEGTDLRWAAALDVARTEGILLEPTYSGRAMLAISDYIKDGKASADKAIILVHTGGIPHLFPLGRYSGDQLQTTPVMCQQRDLPLYS